MFHGLMTAKEDIKDMFYRLMPAEEYIKKQKARSPVFPTRRTRLIFKKI